MVNTNTANKSPAKSRASIFSWKTRNNSETIIEEENVNKNLPEESINNKDIDNNKRGRGGDSSRGTYRKIGVAGIAGVVIRVFYPYFKPFFTS